MFFVPLPPQRSGKSAQRGKNWTNTAVMKASQLQKSLNILLDASSWSHEPSCGSMPVQQQKTRTSTILNCWYSQHPERESYTHHDGFIHWDCSQISACAWLGKSEFFIENDVGMWHSISWDRFSSCATTTIELQNQLHSALQNTVPKTFVSGRLTWCRTKWDPANKFGQKIEVINQRILLESLKHFDSSTIKHLRTSHFSKPNT